MRVDSRSALVEHLDKLAAVTRDGTQPVENYTAADILEAAAAWIQDMDGYYANRGETPPEAPTWSTIADIFTAALVYE